MSAKSETDGRKASDTLELSRVDKSTYHTSRNAISGEEVDVSGPGSSGDPGAVAGMLSGGGGGAGAAAQQHSGSDHGRRRAGMDT